MRMRQPNLLIIESTAVNTGATVARLAIIIAAVDVFAWFDAVENAVDVVPAPAFFTRAEALKCFGCIWYSIFKYLEDDSAPLLILLIVCGIANANVEIALVVFGVEWWKLIICRMTLRIRLFFVNTIREHVFVFVGCFLIDLQSDLLQCFELCTVLFFLRVDFDYGFDVLNSLIILLQFEISCVAMVEGFVSCGLFLQDFCTKVYGVSVITL